MGYKTDMAKYLFGLLRLSKKLTFQGESTQFLVLTHVMRRPCWCTKQRQNIAQVKSCIIKELHSQNTFSAIALYTNMAAVTSHENRECAEA